MATLICPRRVYVGNIPFGTCCKDIKEFFGNVGTIEGIIHKQGFSFVEFSSNYEALDAITQFHGQVLNGRKLVVSNVKNNPAGYPNWCKGTCHKRCNCNSIEPVEEKRDDHRYLNEPTYESDSDINDDLLPGPSNRTLANGHRMEYTGLAIAVRNRSPPPKYITKDGEDVVFTCCTPNCESYCVYVKGSGVSSFLCPHCKKTSCIPCNVNHEGFTCGEYKFTILDGQKGNKKQGKNFDQVVPLYKTLMIVEESMEVVPSPDPFQCPICLEDFMPGKGVILQECLHTFCRECLVLLIEKNDSATVQCPYNNEYRCDQFLQDREIKGLVSEETYRRHIQRSLQDVENQLSNKFHCRTRDCTYWTIYEEDDTEISDQPLTFECEICKQINCINCGVIHWPDTCHEYKERVRNALITRSEKMVEECITNKLWMKCPNCGIIIEKEDGCDGITCLVCKTDVCWVTQGPRWGKKGKGDYSGGCQCKLNGRLCHPNCTNCH